MFDLRSVVVWLFVIDLKSLILRQSMVDFWALLVRGLWLIHCLCECIFFIWWREVCGSLVVCGSMVAECAFLYTMEFVKLIGRMTAPPQLYDFVVPWMVLVAWRSLAA